MTINSIFNATVCIMGIAILSIHAINSLFKKNKREDEKRLLIFLVFTIFHFITYLSFTFIKTKFTNDLLIMSFYTTFYMFNNIEMFLLFFYMLSYVVMNYKIKKIMPRDEADWIRVEGVIPVIVDRDVFDSVQMILAKDSNQL